MPHPLYVQGKEGHVHALRLLGCAAVPVVTGYFYYAVMLSVSLSEETHVRRGGEHFHACAKPSSSVVFPA